MANARIPTCEVRVIESDKLFFTHEDLVPQVSVSSSAIDKLVGEKCNGLAALLVFLARRLNS